MSQASYFELPVDRPDRCVHASVSDAAELMLRQSRYLQLRRVHCEEQGDKLVLHGRLPSYYLKQIAQTTVAAVAAEHPIVNEIEVVNCALVQ